jgi:hypothetical protein
MAESRIASLCAHASGETAWRGNGNGSTRTALVAKIERSTAARSGGDLSASISMVGLFPLHRLQTPARRCQDRRRAAALLHLDCVRFGRRYLSADERVKERKKSQMDASSRG